MRIFWSLPGLLGLAALLSVAVAHAEESRSDGNEFELQVGAFLSEFDTDVMLRGPGGGDRIDFENVLGLESKQTSFRSEFAWRFAPRHRVTVGYYEFNRSDTAAAGRTFVVETPSGLRQFDAGAMVRSEFEWRLVPIFYSYTFHEGDRFSASASLGAHWLKTSASLAAMAAVNDSTQQAVSSKENISAPLPVVGLEGVYEITSAWRVAARAQYFGIEYDAYSGSLTDLRLISEYRFSDGFGVGIGYTWFETDVTKTRDGFKFGVEHSYSGFEAFLGLRF